MGAYRACSSLITSQFDTAPKQRIKNLLVYACLITSQFDTAPKPDDGGNILADGLITSQFDTAPKRFPDVEMRKWTFDYQSVRHCSKTND